MIYRKHPIRSLLTSMLKKATIRYPRMYTLSSSKSIKGSNYGEFLKDKKCFMYTTVQVRSEFGKFAYTAFSIIAKCKHVLYVYTWSSASQNCLQACWKLSDVLENALSIFISAWYLCPWNWNRIKQGRGPFDYLWLSLK